MMIDRNDDADILLGLLFIEMVRIDRDIHEGAYFELLVSGVMMNCSDDDAADHFQPLVLMVCRNFL